MANNNQADDSSLVEDLGVLTASTAAGTALFFRLENPARLNEYAIKADLYMTEVKKLWAENINNLPGLTTAKLDNVVQTVNAKYNDIGPGGASFRLSNTASVNRIVDYYSKRIYSKELIKNFYTGESASIALRTFNSLNIQNEAVRTVLADQIEKMAQTPEDFIQIKASLQARLNYDDYQEAVRYGEAIRDDILTWQKENPLNIWEQGAGSRRLESYLDVTLGDPEQMWIEQEARKNGLTGRIANFIYGDTRAATFKDLIDLYDNGTPEQKKYVRNLLRNSVSINATADELLRSGLFQQGNDLFDKVAGETAITKGAVGIEDIEILKAYRNDLSDDTKRRFFDMLEIDNLRFDKNGRLFTTSDLQSVAQRFGKELGKVTPLNLLHLSDIIVAAQDTRTSLYLNAGTKDFVSAKLVLNQGDDQVLNKPVYFNDGHVFVLEGDEFIERKDLANQLEIHNRRVGVTRRTYEAFAGYQKSPYLTEDTPSILGMSITKWEETLEYGNNADLFGKITQDNANVITNALNVITQNSNVAEEEIYRAVGVVNGLRRYTDFLTKRTTTMDLVSARRLRNALGNTNRDASQLLDLIIELNENKANLETVMTRLVKAGSLKDRNSFNPYLNRTINAYIYDPQSIRQRLNTRRDPMGYSKGKYVTVDYIESLTDELANEFYARYSKDNGVAGLFEFLTENLDEKEANEAKSAAAIFDYRRRLNFPGLRLDDGTDRVAREFSNVAKGFQDFVSDINKGNTDAVAVKNQIEYINKVFGYDFEREGENIRLSVMQQMSQDGLVLKPGAIYNKSQDIIKEINEGHLNKAFGLGLENVYRGVGQLWSGRSSVNSYTRYSAIGGHLMFRLNDMLREVDNFMLEGPGFKSLGLNVHLALRPEDTTSGGAIFKNLLLKRVAPVVATYKALEFADDIADAVFGRGIFETALSGAANIDLVFRKATDATGLTSVLDNLLKDNAIAEYISGYGDDTPGFYSYEQEKHYYEKGYTAIRKARFWDFGSSNEFRGGRISYWEPNTLRLVSSDYRDESLYNGEFWTKYSPWQLIDPYYLEHLHYEDRPYPVSGSMFADSTPWGIVLNATIGDLIKPKIRMHTDRLQDGQDVQAIIYHINEAIRNKENSNLFYMEMGRLKSMAFNAYNAPTYSERIVSVNNEGEVTAAGDYGAYYTPMAISSDTYGKMVDSLIANQSPQLTFSDKINIAAARGNPLAKLAAFGTKQSALNILRQNNQSIYARSLNSDATAKAGYDKTQGYMREEGLGGYDPVEQLLSDSDTVAELLQAGSANDYVQQMAISARMLGGIYGWMASNATGLGDNKYDRIATSADMYSFSRRFWDSGIGGFGGDTMEIIRRVIPEYRRFQTVNPLMNTMPDWLPERFRFGDQYTSVPNGEARLPGRGYESLNELHSDIYGRYGAFDRFKILADIAPYSAEYKFWKRVVQKTVKDPELQAEIEEIKDRVAEQSRQHDFAPYKYVGRDVERQNVVITEVLANGQFKVFGSDQTYKLAGVRVKPNENETGEEVLARYLTPGTEATLVYDTNPAYSQNDDKAKSINAALVINGESLGDIMLQNNDAVERANDSSAASYMARHGTFVNTVNYLSEALMHADIPVFHSRWLRANDALEDYLDEYLYGVSFQSWDDVLETFVIPNMRKAASSEFWTAAGITTDILRNNIQSGKTTRYNMLSKWFTETYDIRRLVSKNAQETLAFDANSSFTKWVNRAHWMTGRGALMGKLTANVLFFGQDKSATIESKFRRGGTMLTLGYSALVAPESLGVSLMSWSRLGYMASEYLEGRHGGKLALAGAAIGLARWAGTVKLLNGTDTLQDQYIPTSARERWEIQDYFDRLTYIKYMALYDEAAEMALSEEGTDIRKIIESQDKEYREIRESKKELEKIIEDIGTPRNAEEEQLLKDLRARLRNTSPTRVALTGGEYTKSAIMYYNAARATMYALDETSSMTDIVRALPKTERDYFMEFVQEKDPEKRQEILSYVSPSLQRALRMLWYGDFTRPESNESFFADHELPAPTWGGWNPNVDLEDVMAKTIQNEGMLASDFGIYTSQYEEPGVINAPEIDNWDSGNGTMIAALNIQMLLNGAGLIGTEVSVEPQQDSTLQVIANIGRVVEYNIDQEINKLFDLL